MNKDSVYKYVDKLDSITDFQVLNGLILIDEAKTIRARLKECRVLAENDEVTATERAHSTFDIMIGMLGKKPLRTRLLYIYGVHIWFATLVLSVVLLSLLLAGYLATPILGNYYPATLAWGGLGGSAYTIFYLRKNVWEYTLSKVYAVYWLVYPLAGMFFGFAAGLAVMIGLVAIKGVPASPDTYYLFAFLAGMFQHWITGTLRDIANVIHTPSNEK